MKHRSLLTTVGARVRALRERQGLARRQLSEMSGVSERFLAQLESGRGNISLLRFAEVADALGTTPAELLAGASTPRNGTGVVALLGVRGAGKSTIGAELARRFAVPFVEVDAQIEKTAGLRLSEIFELHGEAYYRRVEREVLGRLLGEAGAMVIATGGSIVNDRENYSLLRERAATVWLKARPEDHWNRVIQQGDERPMAKNPHAFSELRALLAAREPLYANAHHVIDTHGTGVDDVVVALSDAIGTALGA
ncbi:MAG TPA: shikimate kinase [Kofleriaceae bacterium]|jgi:XRE family aerobic/anaerobic benzoate catabolism transcriptional regulator|nr:shikimate kinase [Kofleriaceae bacterium]